MQLAVFGKTPLISLAELESLVGPDNIEPIDHIGVLLKPDVSLDISSLGGTQKIGQLISTLDTTDWKHVRKYLTENYKQIIKPTPDSKQKLGISVYGANINPKEINATALSLKKQLKNSGYSSRVIPNKNAWLNSAQVIHGGLVKQNGTEILIIISKQQTFVAITTVVQDIDSYSARDQARPKRDSFVGMLPPKLAQSIINLASGQEKPTALLDPFCGTGVVLQEALLMDIDTIGSDLNPKMTDYTTQNLDWLKSNDPNITAIVINVATADATKHTWADDFQTIACETYLGRPLSSKPGSDLLNKIVSDCDTIHNKFLQNVTKQTKPGFRMCIAVPAWSVGNGFRHLKTLDHLSELGYNQLSFVHSGDKKLIYHRKGQFVARELVVLERI